MVGEPVGYQGVTFLGVVVDRVLAVRPDPQFAAGAGGGRERALKFLVGEQRIGAAVQDEHRAGDGVPGRSKRSARSAARSRASSPVPKAAAN